MDDTTTGSIDDREAFRIDDVMELHYRKAEPAELTDPVFDDNEFGNQINILSQFARIDHESANTLHHISERQAEVADYLRIINQKMIMLAKSIVDQDPTVNLDVEQEVNVSELGLAFYTDHPYEKDDMLRLQMVLRPHYHSLNCFAHVVKIKPVLESDSDYDEKRPYFIAIEFKMMSPMDQQILARHIFQKQSEDRRRKAQSNK